MYVTIRLDRTVVGYSVTWTVNSITPQGKADSSRCCMKWTILCASSAIIYGCNTPVTKVQLCSSGGGSHKEVLVQVEVDTAKGRYPSLHWISTIAPSLVCE